MKKYLILTLTLLFLLCACGKQEQTTPATEPESEVIQTAPDTVPEATEPEVTEAPGQEAEGETQTPGKTGTAYRLVRMTALDESGNENWHQEYTYDDYGREKLTEQYTDGVITSSTTITYTDSGRELLYTYPEGRTMTVRETWDAQGNLVLWECIEDGAVEYYTEYTYNDQGWLLSYITVYTQEGSTMSCTYEYDDRGNQILVCEYTGDELMGKTQREFDENNRRTKAVYSDALSDWGFTYEYTWEGNTETAVQFDSDGAETMKTVTAYDETGNILSQETWQEGVMVSCTEYTYENIEIIAE